MARWPAPGRCKRRLAAGGIGAERAAAIQRRLTLHTLASVREAARLAAGQLEPVLAVGGLGQSAACRWGQSLGMPRTLLQGEGSLGTRLQRQVGRARREGCGRVLLIGSDLPQLCATDLLAALAALEIAPLVLGPALDGGYWLIGLGGSWPQLFAGLHGPIGWGGEAVLERTRAAAAACGLPLALLPERADLDRPADLARWR
jgi:rSAM/selenodomain-associated transferase 1